MQDKLNLLMAQIRYWQTQADYFISCNNGDPHVLNPQGQYIEDAQHRAWTLMAEAEELIKQMHPEPPL